MGLPHASKRTISPITRQTDLESDCSRDGTRSTEPERRPRMAPRPHWVGCQLGGWLHEGGVAAIKTVITPEQVPTFEIFAPGHESVTVGTMTEATMIGERWFDEASPEFKAALLLKGRT